MKLGGAFRLETVPICVFAEDKTLEWKKNNKLTGSPLKFVTHGEICLTYMYPKTVYKSYDFESQME